MEVNPGCQGLRYTHKKLDCASKFFFSKKVCLNTKISLRLKKKKKKNFGGNFKNTLKIFCRRHQKMLVIQLILLLTYLILLRGSDCVQGLENSKSIHKVQV